jgi:hypothetical protein
MRSSFSPLTEFTKRTLCVEGMQLGNGPEDNIATIIRTDELFPCLAKLKFDNRLIVGMKISNDSLSLPIENPNPLINRDRQMSSIVMQRNLTDTMAMATEAFLGLAVVKTMGEKSQINPLQTKILVADHRTLHRNDSKYLDQ